MEIFTIVVLVFTGIAILFAYFDYRMAVKEVHDRYERGKREIKYGIVENTVGGFDVYAEWPSYCHSFKEYNWRFEFRSEAEDKCSELEHTQRRNNDDD